MHNRTKRKYFFSPQKGFFCYLNSILDPETKTRSFINLSYHLSSPQLSGGPRPSALQPSSCCCQVQSRLRLSAKGLYPCSHPLCPWQLCSCESHQSQY